MILSNPPPTTTSPPVTTHPPHSPSLIPRNLLLLPQPIDALLISLKSSSSAPLPRPRRCCQPHLIPLPLRQCLLQPQQAPNRNPSPQETLPLHLDLHRPPQRHLWTQLCQAPRPRHCPARRPHRHGDEASRVPPRHCFKYSLFFFFYQILSLLSVFLFTHGYDPVSSGTGRGGGWEVKDDGEGKESRCYRTTRTTSRLLLLLRAPLRLGMMTGACCRSIVPSGRQMELMYILAYDILFGQEFPSIGDAETYLMLKKDALRSALSRILSCKGVKNVEDLMELDTFTAEEFRKPRYVRVSTIKIDAEYAIRELRQEYEVQKDDMVPDLLILPPGADLHKNPLVVNGSIFLQGKASSMAYVALEPKAGWEVIDACSAPGNKTVHLASLMKVKGKIVACELDEERVKLLKHTVELAGAKNQ
ncbi:hypothetical protein OROMI_011718 [Orobanche minor]